MYKCKYCDREFDKSTSIPGHIKYCKNGPHRTRLLAREYKGRGWDCLNRKTDVYCIYCGKYYDNIRKLNGHKIHCRANPDRLIPFGGKGHPHTEESRRKISEKRKVYLQDHPEARVSHHGPSAPEIYLAELLERAGYRVIRQYGNPRLWKRHFRADIFLPDLNLIIEVNGTFKYINGTLKSAYIERENIIKSSGFKVLNVHSSAVWNFSLDSLKTI